jgi:glycosyltransferase involved in cell wall biosynthesis
MEIRKLGGHVITTSDVRSRPLRLIDMMRTTFQKRREYEVAHVTVFSGLAFFYAEWVSRLLSALGKICTFGLHGGNLPGFARCHPKRTRQLLGRAELVVCPSRYLFEEMKAYRTGLHLIPNAIELNRYPISNSGSLGARLLWLRAFHHIYNPGMAVNVLSRVLKSVPQASMTMVGPDKGDGSLQATKKMARDAGVLERIDFAGPSPTHEVPRIMARHDVFLNTTNVDNAPVSVIEAMASRLPIVSTNVGGIPYLLEHGQTALLVKAADFEGMAAAVKAVVTEPDLALHLKTNGRQLAESFDWKVVLPQWHRLLTASASKNAVRAVECRS